jgi:hypothetical protein
MKKVSNGASLISRLLNGAGKNAPERDTHQLFTKHASSGEMEVVFQSGGVAYYRFSNEQRIPAFRAMAARDVFQELEFKTSREMATAYIDAAVEQLNAGELAKAGALLTMFRERMDYITNIDLLYKLASVLYLDNSENPEDYDAVYNYEKIQRWKREKDVEAFFLQTPIIEYLPFSDLQQIGLKRFTELQRSEDARQSQTLLRTLSPVEQNDATRAALHSLMEAWGSSPH